VTSIEDIAPGRRLNMAQADKSVTQIDQPG
jgi:hypothetical protein